MRNTSISLPKVRFLWLLVGLLVLPGVVSACAAPRTSQRLRIVNGGSADIIDLFVLFPGPSADSEATRVSFGDLPAGATSGYQDIPGGVYRYAAYEYMLDGHVVNQAVVDWLGERPMVGKDFTYRIELDPRRPAGGQIGLLDVLVDAR